MQFHQDYIPGKCLKKKCPRRGWGDESLASLEHNIFSSYQYWGWGVNYECIWGEQIYGADNGGGEILLIMLKRETNERTALTPWQIEDGVNDKSS